MEMEQERDERLSMTSVLKTGATLFLRDVRRYLLVTLIVYSPLLAWIFCMVVGINRPSGGPENSFTRFRIHAWIVFVTILCAPLMTGFVICNSHHRLKKAKKKMRECFGETLRYFFPILAISMLTYAIFLINLLVVYQFKEYDPIDDEGSILRSILNVEYIPSCIAASFILVTCPVLVMERTTILRALRIAIGMSCRYWLRITIVIYLIYSCRNGTRILVHRALSGVGDPIPFVPHGEGTDTLNYMILSDLERIFSYFVFHSLMVIVSVVICRFLLGVYHVRRNEKAVELFD